MNKLLIAVVIALFFLGVYAWAADQEDNFAGTWVLDKEKSDLFPKPLMGNSSGVAVSEGRGTAGMGGPAASGRAGGGGFGGGPPGGFGGAMPKTGPPPEPPPLVVEQNGDEVKLTSSSFGKPFIETIKCDGKETETTVQAPGSADKLKQVTKATIKKGKLQVERITYYPGYQGKVKRVYSLSKQGKTLTMKMEDTTNPKMMMVQTQVYTRK